MTYGDLSLNAARNIFFNDLKKCYLIAEIGVNHNGDPSLAKEMILRAKESGADAVKFQTFKAERLASKKTPKAPYQINSTPNSLSHYDMLKGLELNEQAHQDLFSYCKMQEIDFISTPYDIESAKYLVDLGVSVFKTASADLIDLPLHRFIASTGLASIVATGMADLQEVSDVVSIYKGLNNQNIVLLHCVSNYPCSDQSLNMLAMSTMATEFNLPVGFSDHSIGSFAAPVAVALGAKVIEKHFTLDRNLPGPDHKASVLPEEFLDLRNSIRKAELILGDGIKLIQPEEEAMARVSRKSIALAKAKSKGSTVFPQDIKLIRPGTGISPKFLNEVIGRTANSDFDIDHILNWSDLS